MKRFVKLEKMIDKYWLVAVFGAAVVFFVITMLLSVGQPVWFDEGYSILLAKSSYSELLSLTAVDAHPPLFYLLLKFWGDIFGYSEFALRSMSALFISAAVVVAALTLRKMFSKRVALIALPFIVFAPFLLRYGYEVRMYALATLIAVSATFALVKARAAKGWEWWIVYGTLVALGMYTLYMIVAVWFAHFVWLLAVSIKSRQRPFWRWKWLWAFACAVILFLPYIPTFINQLIHSALPGMGNEMTITQVTNIASTLTMYTPEWSLGGWGTVVLALIAAGVVWMAIPAYKKLNKEEKRSFMLLASLSAVPILFYGLISLPPRDPVFIVRYMAHSAIFIYMLLGVVVALALLKKRNKKKDAIKVYVISAVILATLLYGVVMLQKAGNFNYERLQQPETVSVREAADCSNDQTIAIADDPYTYIDSAYYFQDCQLHFFSEDNVNYKGGYAMLHNSPSRISSPSEVTAERVVHLGWNGQDPKFVVDERYVQVSTQAFDKQVVTVFKLSAE